MKDTFVHEGRLGIQNRLDATTWAEKRTLKSFHKVFGIVCLSILNPESFFQCILVGQLVSETNNKDATPNISSDKVYFRRIFSFVRESVIGLGADQGQNTC